MATKLGTYNGVTVYRANNNDCNGNPRAIVHFTDFLRPGEDCFDTFGGIIEAHAAMLKRAKKAGFRNYKAREFGGGFICQYDYCNGREIAERVIKAREY